MLDQEGALSEIVQHERRQHDDEPRQPDRTRAEMPHVGIQCLTPGDGQEHRTQHHKAEPSSVEQETEAVDGIDGTQHRGFPENTGDAETRDQKEPDQHDRTEDAPHSAGPSALAGKQPHQDDDGNRDHIRRQLRGRHHESFDGTEHRDGRGDHAITVEQCGSEQPHSHHDRAQAGAGPAGPGFGKGQGHQRQDAPLALVVRPHDENDVFDRNDEDQRPEDQGQDAHDVVPGRLDTVFLVETFTKRVQRAGSDVAIDDAKGGERQTGEPGPGGFRGVHEIRKRDSNPRTRQGPAEHRHAGNCPVNTGPAGCKEASFTE